MDEKILVQRAVTGDKEAFAGLYTRYKDSLYRYAYFKLGNEPDAQDALNDCIVAAYQSIGTLRNEKLFSAWIFRILYRCCCAYVKTQIEQNTRADISSLERIATEDPRLLSVEVREALSQLEPIDRDIVLLSTVAGYNSREVATLIGIKASTIRSRLSRSLKKMRTFLE